MRKPLDIGDGYSCASYLPTGEVLAITRPHAVHGMVELTGAEPFDETSRGDAGKVRAYRASLANATSAFLRPLHDAAVTSVRMAPDGALHVALRWDGAGEHIGFEFSGRLQRPPYAEITDIAPLPPLPSDSELVVHAQEPGSLIVRSPGLGAAATVAVHGSSIGGGWTRTERDSATWSARLPHVLEGEGEIDVEVVVALSTEWDPPVDGLERISREERRAGLAGLPVPSQALGIVLGIAEYVRECCALRVERDEAVIVTDHRLLPLSWTRDAYYMALLLLLLGEADDAATVERHLAWLWGRARGSGAWMRSHLTNGSVKDPGLQGDQQLFPVLELLDYRATRGEWPSVPPGAVGWGKLVDAALVSLPLDAGTGLVESAENPADDPAEYPLLFSTQLIYLRVLEGLARYGGEIGLDPEALMEQSARVRAEVGAVFTTDGPEGPMFAYEADGLGGVRLYADANDVPTALAPAWGFCNADDTRWLGTMRFAFSSSNPAWSPGPLGGLGSAHTPGVWPLGDLQEYVAALARADEGTANRVLAKLISVAASDGHLPEAYDAHDGRWLARHWFGWPSAAVAAALLSDARMATWSAENGSSPAEVMIGA